MYQAGGGALASQTSPIDLLMAQRNPLSADLFKPSGWSVSTWVVIGGVALVGAGLVYYASRS